MESSEVATSFAPVCVVANVVFFSSFQLTQLPTQCINQASFALERQSLHYFSTDTVTTKQFVTNLFDKSSSLSKEPQFNNSFVKMLLSRSYCIFSGVCVIFSCYCCVLDADALTGFSNPNYSLNHDDTLNSNRLPPTPHPYNLSSPTPGSFSLPPTLHDNGTTTMSDTSSVTSNGTRKNRSKYADTHLRDMGVAPDVTMVTSPVESEGHFSMQSSAVASPDETQDDVTSNGDATMTSSKNDVRVQQSISTQRLLQ